MAAANNDVTVNLRVDVGASAAEVQRLTQEIGNLSNAIAKTSGNIKVHTTTVQQTSNALNGASNAARKTGASVTDLTRGVFQGNLAFFTLRGTLVQIQRGFSLFADAVRSAVTAASEKQVAVAKLDVLLRNVGEGTTGLKDKILELATEYQRLTGVGDDVIVNISGQLTAFGATKENIERLTKASLDLSTAMGKDVNAAALLIGKALQGQFATLSRFGIVVDEGATKAHKLEQALKIIEARFGGSAAAQVQNYSGQMGILSQMLGALSEEFGKSVVENENFVNALRGGVKEVIGLTEKVAGMRDIFDQAANTALRGFANLLPSLANGFFNLTDLILDGVIALSKFAEMMYNVIKAMGGLASAIAQTAILYAGAQTLIILLTVAFTNLRIAILETGAAFLALPWGRLAALAAIAITAALSLTGVFDGLVEKLTDVGDGSNEFAQTSKEMQEALKAVRQDALNAAQGIKDLVNNSINLNTEFKNSVDALQKTAEELGVFDGLSLEMDPEKQQALQTYFQNLQTYLLDVYNKAVAAGVALDNMALAAANSIPGIAIGAYGPPAPEGKRTDPPKDKPKTNDALDSLKEEIEATRLEIKIREEGIAQARLVAETDALVAAGKKGVSAKSAELAAQLAKEKVALIEIQRAEADLKKVQDLLYDTPRDIQMIQARIVALQTLNQSTVKAVDIKKAEALAEAKVLAERAKTIPALQKEQLLRDAVTKATLENQESILSSAQQENASVNKSIELRAKELDLLTLVHAGKLSMEEAEIQLAKAQAESNGQTGENVELLARQEQAIEKLRKKIEDTTIDLGESINNIIDGLVDGILQGTNKGLDAMEIFKRSGQAIFGDMLKGMLKDKLGFDGKFRANFLNDLPAMVKGGADIIGGIWNGLFGGMSTGGDGSGGGWSQVANGIGSIAGIFGLTGQTGQAVQGAGSLAQFGLGAVNGNLGQVVSNTGSVVSVLKGIYNGFNAWRGGATITEAFNVAIGGASSQIAGAVGEGLANIAPGFVGYSDAVLGASTVPVGATSGAEAVAMGTQGATQVGVIGGIANALTSYTTWASFGILTAIVAAVEAFMGLNSLEEGRGNVFGNEGTRKLFMGGFDKFTMAVANFTAGLGSLSSFMGGGFWGGGTSPGGGSNASNLLGSFQRTQFGGAGAMDWANLFLTLNPGNPLAGMILPLYFFSMFTKPKTGGTVTRNLFEGFLEDKGRKHESRRFAPFWGNVPVWQDGEWIKGNFDRSLGQDFAKDFESSGQGTFTEGLREFIKLQGQSIGLSDKQIKQFEALGFVFKTSIIGDKGGNQSQRDFATIAAMLGSLAEGGANAATSIELLKLSLAKIDTPSNVFKELSDRFQEGKMSAQEYRDVIEALAELYNSGIPKLQYDLSEKNQKGLDVAKEELEAINAAFRDVPHGVKPGLEAIRLLDKAINEMGEQGIITFEELQVAIEDAVASANLINPEILNFFGTISKGATEAIKAGTEDALIDNALQTFVTNLGRQIQDMISESIVNGFLDASVNTGILAPFNERVREANETFMGSGRTQEDLDAYIAELRDAGLDAIQMIKDLGPALREFAQIALDIGKAFDDALLAETAGDAVSLAAAIRELQIAQQNFNDEIDARIFALRNQGKKDPEIVRRPLPQIAKDFQIEMITFFGGVTDVVRAAQSGLIEHGDMELILNKQLLATDQERMDALNHMRQLAEQDLAIRIEAIQIRAQNEIDAHNDRIKDLQDEREQIQDNYEAMIEARQEELDAIQKQIELAEKWQDVLKTLEQTIFDMTIGQDSPLSPTARLSVAQDQFDMFSQQLRDTSLSTDQRVEAANKLSELGPQLLQLFQAIGKSQSSEDYARIFDNVIGALEEARLYAKGEMEKATGGKTIEELQADANRLQEEIKQLQKDQKQKLKDIEDQIKHEEEAIVAIQERVQRDIDKVSNNTAGVLEWIKGKGNEIFERQTEKLKTELQELGVDSASLYGVQTDSFLELLRIRKILEGEGINVTMDRDPNPNGGNQNLPPDRINNTPPRVPNQGNQQLPPDRIEGPPRTGRSSVEPTDLGNDRFISRTASARSDNTGSGITIQQLTVEQNPSINIEAEGAFTLTEQGIREARPMMKALMQELLTDTDIVNAIKKLADKSNQNFVRRV